MIGILFSVCSVTQRHLAYKESAGQFSAGDTAISEREKTEIAETIFRYQLEHVRLRNSPQLYFLSLGEDADPPAEFLTRFSSLPYPVKRFSESTYQRGHVIEKATQNRGIRLETKSIRRLSVFEVEVEGSWFVGRDDFQEQIFEVKRENGKWVIQSIRNVMDI